MLEGMFTSLDKLGFDSIISPANSFGIRVQRGMEPGCRGRGMEYGQVSVARCVQQMILSSNILHNVA